MGFVAGPLLALSRLRRQPRRPPARGPAPARDRHPGRRLVDERGHPPARHRAGGVGPGHRRRRGPGQGGPRSLRQPGDLPLPRLVPPRRGLSQVRPRPPRRPLPAGAPGVRRLTPRAARRPRRRLRRAVERAVEHRHRRPPDADRPGRGRGPGRAERGAAATLRVRSPPGDRLRRLGRGDRHPHRDPTESPRRRLPRRARRRPGHVHRLDPLRRPDLDRHAPRDAAGHPGDAGPQPRGRGGVHRGGRRARGRAGKPGRGERSSGGHAVDAAGRRAGVHAVDRSRTGPGILRPLPPPRRVPPPTPPGGRSGAAVCGAALRGPGLLAEASVRADMERRGAGQLGHPAAVRRRALPRDDGADHGPGEVGGRGRGELRAWRRARRGSCWWPS